METESMLSSQQIFLPLPLTCLILAVLSTMAKWTLPPQGKCWALCSFPLWTPRHQKKYVQATLTSQEYECRLRKPESAMMHSPQHHGLLGLLIQSKRDFTGHRPQLWFLAKQPLLPAAPTIYQSLKDCSVVIQIIIMSFRTVVIYPDSPSKHLKRQRLISGDF